MKKLTLFERVITEAPEDPPDLSTEETAPPPDIPPDLSMDDAGPPDLDDGGGLSGGEMGSDQPPDLDEDFGEEDSEEFGDTSYEGDESNGINLNLSEKISAVMNQQLYQRFLALLNNIGSQLSMIKNNSDVLYTLSSDSLDIIESLKKLDENIRLYLKDHFLSENYSKNLLFFNKCINFFKLLNDIFNKSIKKGIKSME